MIHYQKLFINNYRLTAYADAGIPSDAAEAEGCRVPTQMATDIMQAPMQAPPPTSSGRRPNESTRHENPTSTTDILTRPYTPVASSSDVLEDNPMERKMIGL